MRDLKEKANDKLKAEFEQANDKSFAEPVIEYLLKRCEEDKGLAEDVLQEHKTWEKCYSYIYEQARGQATGNRAVVRDEVVFEWAEDYFHKDDKAEVKKEKDAKPQKKTKSEKETKKEKKIESPIKEEKKKKKHKQIEELEGQMSIFDMGL